MRSTILAFLIAAMSLASFPIAAPGQAPVFNTPEQLWRDFRPDSPELEIETIKSWREDHAAFETFRFTAEREAGGRVRAFAIRGAPIEGSGLPGILHIHGGGQTASLDWVRFWTKRGYVCVSFDFTGPWPGRKDFTDWGPIKQGNMAEANGGLLVRPTARSSSWYHWALATRRALTVLSYHPKVDRDRLGIFGVSVGGTLCWLVAAIDDRVKTAVPIYGCGYNYDRRKTVWGLPDLDPDVVLFTRVLAPEGYATSISRPILLLDATNDFHGWMDNAYEIMTRIRGTSRLAFTPRYNHHIDEAQGKNLPAWMDWQLRGGPAFPAEPKLELRLDHEGDPVAHVRPADASRVTKVEVFYTVGEKPSPNRFWRRVKSVKSERSWQAKLPVFRTRDPLRAFANVFYQSGICLSTNLGHTIPDRLGAARASLEWSPSPAAEPGEPGAPFVFAAANTDPNVSIVFFVRSDDPLRPDAICLNPALFGNHSDFGIVSHYIGDPGYAGHEGLSLTFDYQGEFLQPSNTDLAGLPKAKSVEPGFTVQVTAHDWTLRSKTWSAHLVVPTFKPGWHHAALAASNFLTADGKPLPGWNDLDKIEIHGVGTKKNPPRFSRFQWAAP
jgi:dienelactone hydrolase